MSREVGSRPADASGRGRRRIRTSLKVLVPTVAALGAGAAIAVGQIGGSGTTYTGCVLTDNGASDFDVPNGSLRVVDPAVTDDMGCTTGEEQITWNQQGPQGPQGTPGVTGPSGPQGAPGTPGATGPA